MLRLVLRDGSGAWAPTSFLENLGLFQRRPDLLDGHEYAVVSDVSVESLDLLLARVFGTPWASSVTAENVDAVRCLCDELGFSGLDADIQAIERGIRVATQAALASLQLRVKNQDALIADLVRQIDALKRVREAPQREVQEALAELARRIGRVEESLESRVVAGSNDVSVVAGDVASLRQDVALLKEGEARLEAAAGANRGAVSERYRARSEKNVLALLREKEAAFAREVVVRKSSADLYGMLDPDSSDGYRSGPDPSAWIEIEFRAPVRVNGLRVMSSNWGHHLKTFDVTFSDGPGAPEKRRVSFVDEARLNGDGLSAEEKFDAVSARLIRIESRGPNWDGDSRFNIGGFELFSPDEAHKGGVFRSIFARDRDRVREVFEVRARDFDGSELHLINGKNVCTAAGEHEWVEFGLVHGRVAPSRYRIKKYKDFLRGWTLRGSNDRNAALDDWAVLHRHREATEAEKTSDVIEFECRSATPFRFFRIVQEEKRWDGDLKLNFKYFDVDGLFIRD